MHHNSAPLYCLFIKQIKKQAGAELCQAQVKREAEFEVWGEVWI